MATKIVNFYSYKGGAGRSVTTFNTLPFLAQELEATPESPILVIDMDLDSAGITFLLNTEKNFKSSGDKDGKMGINKYFYGSDLNLRKTPINYADHCFLGNAVDVSKAIGLVDKSVMFIGVSTDHVNANYQGDGLKTKLNEIKRACNNYNFKAIVFDSASGNQAIAHLLLEISDHIVVCMKATQQFRTGTFRYLNQMIDSNKFKDSVIMTILPVAIPEGVTKLAGDLTFKSSAYTNIKNETDSLKNVKVNFDFLSDENNFGIPEIERFKWVEKNLNVIGKEKLNDKELVAYEKYHLLAKGIKRYDF